MPTKRDCRHFLPFNPNLLAPTTVCESGVILRENRCPIVANHPSDKSSRSGSRLTRDHAGGFGRLQHRNHHHAAQVAALRRAEVANSRMQRARSSRRITGLRRHAERRSFGPRASRRARRGGLGLGRGHRRVRHAEHHARAQEARGRRSQDRRPQTHRAQARSLRARQGGRVRSLQPARHRQTPGRSRAARRHHRLADRDRGSVLDQLTGKKK